MFKTFRDIDFDPSSQDLWLFRAMALGGGITLSLVLHELSPTPHAAVVVAGAGVLLTGLSLLPGLGRWIYVGWTGLGIGMGIIVAPVVMASIFFLLITPVALVFRLIGRDSMNRKFRPELPSYWQPHEQPKNPRRYFQQF